MSLQFSDTSNLKGLVQLYERELGFDPGDVSGNATKLKQFTADANLAFDEYVAMAIRSSGTWQFDDSNQTDYPIITTNLVANQRSYLFTTDESNNLILDIYRVMVKTNGVYVEIDPVDVQSSENVSGFYDGRETTGTPTRYDKTANAIFLDPVPSGNVTNGLKVYINREASYFAYTDTTKKPGVPGLHHRWFYIRPAEEYARRKQLAVYPGLRAERLAMEEAIQAYFSERPRDERRRLQASSGDNR
jgi:hypothetical protein